MGVAFRIPSNRYVYQESGCAGSLVSIMRLEAVSF